jgi:hypothetical protein
MEMCSFLAEANKQHPERIEKVFAAIEDMTYSDVAFLLEAAIKQLNFCQRKLIFTISEE